MTATPAASRRLRRWVVVAVAVVLFLVISALLSRWLGTENAEREAVLEVLQAQARGDSDRMLRDIDCQDDACVARVRANAQRLRAPGDVTIVRVDSATSHTLTGKTAPTRVVWITPGRLPPKGGRKSVGLCPHASKMASEVRSSCERNDEGVEKMRLGWSHV